MKSQMAPNISLAIVLFAAVAAVVLRVAARRPEPRWVPGTAPEPATVTADPSRPRPAVITGTHDGAGQEMPRPTGQPASAVERMQHVFHELHASGRHALCAVCDGQYGAA
jgi:hypothetical protein